MRFLCPVGLLPTVTGLPATKGEGGCVPHCLLQPLLFLTSTRNSRSFQTRGHTGPTVLASPFINQEERGRQTRLLTEAHHTVPRGSLPPRARRCDPGAVAVCRNKTPGGRAWAAGSGGALHCDTPGFQSSECKASVRASTHVSAQASKRSPWQEHHVENAAVPA